MNPARLENILFTSAQPQPLHRESPQLQLFNAFTDEIARPSDARTESQYHGEHLHLSMDDVDNEGTVYTLKAEYAGKRTMMSAYKDHILPMKEFERILRTFSNMLAQDINMRERKNDGQNGAAHVEKAKMSLFLPAIVNSALRIPTKTDRYHAHDAEGISTTLRYDGSQPLRRYSFGIHYSEEMKHA